MSKEIAEENEDLRLAAAIVIPNVSDRVEQYLRDAEAQCNIVLRRTKEGSINYKEIGSRLWIIRHLVHIARDLLDQGNY